MSILGHYALRVKQVVKKKFMLKDNIGLYRDDGLSVFKYHNAHQTDKVRNEMIDLFKHDLNHKIKCNLKIVNCLTLQNDQTHSNNSSALADELFECV